ncbi:MAG: hypothetical protein ACRD3G_17230, partial [Vicinamibacterales bacterium]
MAATMWAVATEKACPWWTGDLLAFGEHKWGDRYHQAASLSGYTEETLRNKVWVSRAVDVSRRRDTLSYSHHVEVAGLPNDEQTKWLDEAETKELSVHTLRRQIQESKIERVVVVPVTVYPVEHKPEPPKTIVVRTRDPHEPAVVYEVETTGASLERVAAVPPAPPESDLRMELRRLLEESDNRWRKVKFPRDQKAQRVYLKAEKVITP